MKNIIYILTIYLSFLCSSNADDKQVAFLTTVGSSFQDSYAKAHNAAYMNSMKIVRSSTQKNGNIWVTIVTVAPKYQ